MATDYNFMILQPSPSNSPRMGNFWLYAKLDCNKDPLGIGDSAKIMKVKDLWVVRDSYWRQTVASAGSETFDIGFVDATGTFAATDDGIVSAAASSASDWTQGTIKPDAAEILTVDSWVFCSNNTAARVDGVFEVLLEIMAGPQDNEPADMQFQT